MPDLIRTRNGGITTLTLNRPDKRNSLSHGLVEELLHCVLEAHDDETHLLVLRGEGKNFSAGFDFTGYETQTASDLLHRFVRVETLLQKVEHAPFTTLALVHGDNFGAGVDLVVACKNRIADPAATCKLPGLTFGLVLGTRRLAARTSQHWARSVLEAALTVESLDACTAGLFTALARMDEWDEHVKRAAASACNLEIASAAVLHRVLSVDTCDADMADLVRSAAAPGLIDRIHRFREGA